MDEEILAELRASTGRRVLGIAMLAGLGALLIYTAMAHPPDVFGWQVFFFAIGFGALWGAERMHRATKSGIVLTKEGLFSIEGEVVANLNNIEAVDRSFFAFKPSNGFLIKLKTKAPRRWQPGLWWRFGRRLGVGGVTPGGQSKVMADILGAMLLERDGKTFR